MWGEKAACVLLVIWAFIDRDDVEQFGEQVDFKNTFVY
jgi:hypothetical protein